MVWIVLGISVHSVAGLWSKAFVLVSQSSCIFMGGIGFESEPCGINSRVNRECVSKNLPTICCQESVGELISLICDIIAMDSKIWDCG